MAITKHLVTVYKDRNSPVSFDVKLNGVDFDLTAEEVNKVSVLIGGVEYSSDDGYIEYLGTMFIFKLGTIPNPPSRKLTGRLIIYSDKYPLGRPIISEKEEHRLLFEFI